MCVSLMRSRLSREELEFAALLKSPAPKLKAYPKQSVVAEKFEAIVKQGMANGRRKDFYDLGRPFEVAFQDRSRGETGACSAG